MKEIEEGGRNLGTGANTKKKEEKGRGYREYARGNKEKDKIEGKKKEHYNKGNGGQGWEKEESDKRNNEKIGIKTEIVEVWKAGRAATEGRETVGVQLAREEQKKGIMRKKGDLRGRKKRIGEDLTWRERKLRWKLEEIAREEERKGSRVWINYGRIRINEE